MNIDDRCSFLRNLSRNVAGNTLAIMAAALIPLTGMVGGGLDMARIYLTKTRLQHACDAAVLAGRQAMGGGTWAQGGNMPNTVATQFFTANFATGAYGSTDLTKRFTEDGGKVSGTASVTLPMTLMKVLGKTSETVEVNCDADMRLPNTDVMFVLDTTGSMDEIPAGDTRSKIASLRVAVKCFYEIVARLDTTATCSTPAPSGGTGSQVQVRFGFMPYSTNVNVGKLLPTSYFADSWSYQSRAPRWWIRQAAPQSNAANFSNTNVASTTCVNGSTSTDTLSNSDTTKTTKTVAISNSRFTKNANDSNGTCTGTKTTTTTIYTKQENVIGGPNDQWIDYHYDKITQNVSGLKNGTGWNSSIVVPVGDYGTGKTVAWGGCIEERQTVRTLDYDPIPTDAFDLDIDMVPTGDVRTQWGFALRDMIFTRKGSNLNIDPVYTTDDYSSVHNFVCPTEARKLQTWSNPTSFESYVDGLAVEGGTYHDIGLLWGARFASPTGIFASENATTPLGGDIQRNIIFMTDGDTHTATKDYAAYGIGWFDRRQTDPGTTPTIPLLDEQVDLRFNALCAKIKNTNKFILWVIAFGTVTDETETKLRNCATSGRYFRATKDAELQASMKAIADQISMLKLTR